MIQITQVTLKPKEAFSQGEERLNELLKKKAAKALKCREENIRSISIASRSVDARKKPEVFFSYTVHVATDNDGKWIKKAASPRVTLFKRKFFDPAEHLSARLGIDAEAVMKRLRPLLEDESGDGEGRDGRRSLIGAPPDDDRLMKLTGGRPVVCGFGPAGMAAAYVLSVLGLKPIIIERGSRVEKRCVDVEHFWSTGELDINSNVQFGEGGAGAFSDGKLNTGAKDRDGIFRRILEILVEHGAPESILVDSKPHIGTDKLTEVVKNIRTYLEGLGAEFLFDTALTGFETDEGGRLLSIRVSDTGRDGDTGGARDVNPDVYYDTRDDRENDKKAGIIPAKHLVLAIGHSARDTFEMLYGSHVEMESKAFAVGYRVMHPQRIIDINQYGEENAGLEGALPAADYKLVTNVESGEEGGTRAVYSFCMCPGGYVVDASSEKGRTVVNGMSCNARDGRFANSAIVMAVTPEDCGRYLEADIKKADGFIEKYRDIRFSDPEKYDILKGMYFQRELEAKAFKAGGGRIPVTEFGLLERWVEGKNAICDRTAELRDCDNGDGTAAKSQDTQPNSGELRDAARVFRADAYNSGDIPGEHDLSEAIRGRVCLFPEGFGDILPEELNKAFIRGMHSLGRQIQGFDSPDTLVAAVEGRTSSPVRIIRDRDSLSSVSHPGIYPAGEGAGYAGGIMSAAADGIRVALALAGEIIKEGSLEKQKCL